MWGPRVTTGRFVIFVVILMIPNMAGTQNTFLQGLSHVGKTLLNDQATKLVESLTQWTMSRKTATDLSRAERGVEYTVHGDVYFSSIDCRGSSMVLPVTSTEFQEYVNILGHLKKPYTRVPYFITNGLVTLGNQNNPQTGPESVLVGGTSELRKRAIKSLFHSFVIFQDNSVGIANTDTEHGLDQLCVLRQSSTILKQQMSELDSKLSKLEARGKTIVTKVTSLLKDLDQSGITGNVQVNEFESAVPIDPNPDEILNVGKVKNYLDDNLIRAQAYLNALTKFERLVRTLSAATGVESVTDWTELWEQNTELGYSMISGCVIWVLMTCICTCTIQRLRYANKNREQRLRTHAMQLRQISSKL